jgi:deoxyribonuclease V
VLADARLRARAGRTHRGATRVPPCRPGEFYLRELAPPRAVPDDLSELGLLVADGSADLNPGGRPGLGARTHAGFGIAVIGAAHVQVPHGDQAEAVLRGSSGRPLFVAAAGMPRADAADLVRHLAGRYPLPDALRRADTPRGQVRPQPP